MDWSPTWWSEAFEIYDPRSGELIRTVQLGDDTVFPSINAAEQK
jgi:hypothetical protein